ncbi:TPA: hypothetical protein DDW35_12235 [Candidatus Sumerlaeota bacterium]|jgi:hypothetical protein|nr:hypothetical protein [Candidatus Sumerlaeota bacterium]
MTDVETPPIPTHPSGFQHRLERIMQHVTEVSILGVVLLCAIVEPMNFFIQEHSPQPRFASQNVLPYVLLWWLGVFIPLAYLACRNFWAAPPTHWMRDRFRRPLLALLALSMIVATVLFLWGVGLTPEIVHLISFAPTSACFSPAVLATSTVLLLLSRICHRPLTFYLAFIVIFGATLGYLHYVIVHPMLSDIAQGFDFANHGLNSTPLKPGIMISTVYMLFRGTLLVLIPFLIALYTVHRQFAWWKMALGWFISWVVVYGILYHSFPELDRISLCSVLFNSVLIFLMLRLPGQRLALERLAGITLATQPDMVCAPINDGAFTRLVGKALLVALGLGLAGFSIVRTYELEGEEQITYAVPVPAYSPALVNACDILKPYFDKRKSVMLKQPKSDAYSLLLQLGNVPRSTMDEIKPLIDPVKIEAENQTLNPALDLFIKASEADYWMFQEPGRRIIPHYINIRFVAQALFVRANICILQDRPTEALANTEILLKVSRLMNGDPSGYLVAHAIGAAVRSIAIAALQNYYYSYRADPAALEQLHAMLERNAHLVRFDFPYEIVARTEPGFWEVVPYFEEVVPGLIRSTEAFYQRWADYDILMLATALEAYHHEQGRYPDTLEQLTPKYLSKLPRQPRDAAPYGYENFGADFRLIGDSHYSKEVPQKKKDPFASNVKESPEVRKALDKLKAKGSAAP